MEGQTGRVEWAAQLAVAHTTVDAHGRSPRIDRNRSRQQLERQVLPYRVSKVAERVTGAERSDDSRAAHDLLDLLDGRGPVYSLCAVLEVPGPVPHQPNVKQYASTPASRNSISNKRSAIGAGWRISW